MPEAQANLKQAAVEFLEAAQAVTAKAGQAPADPLDGVATNVFDLGDLQPAISPAEFEDLKARLGEEQLLPQTIVQLVDLARQVAGVLKGI
jgi:hypothetical protein